jgi:hypothetical protein
VPRDPQVKVALAATIIFGILGMLFNVMAGDIGTALAWLIATLAAGFYFYGHWALVETVKKQRAIIDDLQHLLLLDGPAGRTGHRLHVPPVRENLAPPQGRGVPLLRQLPRLRELMPRRGTIDPTRSPPGGI